MSEQVFGEGEPEPRRPKQTAGSGEAGGGTAAGTARTVRDLLHLLWEHIGMLSALLLGVLATLALLFLAVIGFTPALVLLVVVVAGLAMLIVGGRMRS